MRASPFQHHAASTRWRAALQDAEGVNAHNQLAVTIEGMEVGGKSTGKKHPNYDSVEF